MKLRILVFLFIIAGSLSYAQNPSPVDNEILNQSSKFRTILETAYKYYKDTVDLRKISEIAFNAMLKDLDPYSEYFPEKVYQGYKNSYSATAKSLGLSVASINDTIYVIDVAVPSPADSAGIQAGDKIIYLAGLPAIKMTAIVANEKITPKDSLPVNMVIKRNNNPSLLEFNITPTELSVNSIQCYFIIPGTDIGFIKSNKMAKSAGDEFKEILKELKKKGAKKIFLDFRGHNGGSVDQAANLVDEFIPEGKTITYLQGKHNDFYQKYVSEAGGACEDMPLIVLVDDKTMSAGEIFVGAIQDLDRGLIIGTTTFGKGMVQKAWEFKDGSAFRLTVGDYFTPSGRNIQKTKEKGELDPALRLQLGDASAKSIEKMIEKYGAKTKLPIYKTSKGRPVIGGGGIYPDIFITADTTTLLTQVLISKGIIVDLIYNFIAEQREKLLKKYNKDYFAFEKDFKINDEFLIQLEKLSRTKNIWNEKMFQTDKEYIRNYMKCVAAYNLWGNQGFYSMDYKNDKVILDALKYFEDASKLLK